MSTFVHVAGNAPFAVIVLVGSVGVVYIVVGDWLFRRSR